MAVARSTAEATAHSDRRNVAASVKHSMDPDASVQHYFVDANARIQYSVDTDTDTVHRGRIDTARCYTNADTIYRPNTDAVGKYAVVEHADIVPVRDPGDGRSERVRASNVGPDQAEVRGVEGEVRHL